MISVETIRFDHPLFDWLCLSPALEANVYRVDVNVEIQLMASGINQPNGLAFSPDESILYVVQSRGEPRKILALDVANDGKLSNQRVLIDAGAKGTPDGFQHYADRHSKKEVQLLIESSRQKKFIGS